MSCQFKKKRLDYAIDYVRGELPEAQQDIFEAHYLGCEECFSAVRFAEKTAVTMHHYGASIFAPARAVVQHTLLEKLKAELEDVCLAFSSRWKTAVPALAAYLLLVAVLSGAYFWIAYKSNLAYQHNHVDKPAGTVIPDSPISQDGHLAEWQPLVWSISNETKANAALYARLKAVKPLYLYHNYFAAADKLTEIVKDFPEAVEGYLYLGVIQVRENQPAEAVKNLNKVLELHPEHVAAQWYLAQAHLLQGNLTKAKNLLAALADQGDTYYGKAAAAQLKKIATQS